MVMSILHVVDSRDRNELLRDRVSIDDLKHIFGERVLRDCVRERGIADRKKISDDRLCLNHGLAIRINRTYYRSLTFYPRSPNETPGR